MIKAIIFDFDGVLADTYEFNKKLSKEVGHDVSHEDFKAHHDGNVYEKPKIPFTEETANKFHLNYLENIQNIQPFFSLHNLGLLKENYSLHVISSNKEEPIKKFLNHHGLGLFTEILGVDFHKSKVEKFNFLFKKYNLKPNEAIFITDTLGDILEGHQVGVRTIAVDFGFHDRERLERGNPFKIVSNFNEMLSVIGNL